MLLFLNSGKCIQVDPERQVKSGFQFHINMVFPEHIDHRIQLLRPPFMDLAVVKGTIRHR
jgi:hypothetical protein